MAISPEKNKTELQLYVGFGHSDNLILKGHVLKRVSKPKNRYTENAWHNSLDMMKLFFVRPFPNVRIQLFWNDQIVETISDLDGFFSFQWKSKIFIEPGIYPLKVVATSKLGKEIKSADGQIVIPNFTALGIISDIDDTVMISHSSKFRKRMREIFVKHSQSRKMFPDVELHYKLLSEAQTSPEKPNPFFYVSSSEWNLYGYLNEFFRFNGLPDGIFQLNRIKRWFQLFKSGKTNHTGKIERMVQVIEAYPERKFVLLGDNSQADPTIYFQIVEQFGDRISAVYIRNVRKSKEKKTLELLAEIALKGVHICFHKTSLEAISDSIQFGLVDENALSVPESN